MADSAGTGVVQLDNKTARKMAPTLPVMGLAVRIHADGTVHPWCAALAFPGEFDRAEKFLMHLPDGVYVSPPYDTVHGDLILLPSSVDDQAEAIARMLRERDAEGVFMADSWADTSLARRLVGRGVTLFTVRTYHAGEVSEVHGIGGDEGEDIALLTDADHREHDVWYYLDGGRYEYDEQASVN